MNTSKKGMNNTELYYVRVFKRIFRFVPITAGAAAGFVTLVKLSGGFANIGPGTVITFDCICALYFFICYFVIRRGITRDGQMDYGLLKQAQIVLILCTVLQWNLVSYIFPARELWATACFYFLIAALLFDSRTVLYEIIGILLSIGVSWIIVGDALLPVRDEQYIASLCMRIITLAISSALSYLMTLNTERLLKLSEENAQSLEEKNERLLAISRNVIDFTADLIEQRDSTSGTHVKRVKDYVRILATEAAEHYPEYALSEEIIEDIVHACVLHDVGKIIIPDQILLKPSKLSAEEFDMMKTHTTRGAEIIDSFPDSVEDSFLRYGKEIAAYHHERYDGKGYPEGLVGDRIPISAQIVSLADCFDALTSTRPYKAAFSVETAYDMILTGQCGAFSENLLFCFRQCRERFAEVADTTENPPAENT